MAIRYEDLVVNFEHTTQKIYNFIQNPESLKTIKQQLKTKLFDQSEKILDLPDDDNNIKYQTTRADPKKIIFDWVHSLSWKQINLIQTSCGDFEFMEKRLGYQFVWGESQYQHLNNLTRIGEGYGDRYDQDSLWMLNESWDFL